MRIPLVLLLFTVSFLLTSCGYHLRGAYDLPKQMKNVYLDGGSANFREQFISMLRSSSAQLAKSPEQADLILRISQDTIERRTLSLSERGRSNEIQLAGHLVYQILDKNNKVLSDATPIDFVREYFNDQQDVIAKDNEEIVIRNEMYQQVIKRIITRFRVMEEPRKS